MPRSKSRVRVSFPAQTPFRARPAGRARLFLWDAPRRSPAAMNSGGTSLSKSLPLGEPRPGSGPGGRRGRDAHACTAHTARIACAGVDAGTPPRPSVATALFGLPGLVRFAGALFALCVALAPSWVSAGEPTVPESPAHADGGACSEERPDDAPVPCSALAGRPIEEAPQLRWMRSLAVEASPEQCRDLLTQLWDRERCLVQGRDCGKLLSLAPPVPTPKLASSSASAHGCIAGSGPAGTTAVRLAHPGDDEPPIERGFAPPTPPPRR